MSSHRGSLIEHARAACQWHPITKGLDVTLPYEKVFSSKVTLIDGVIIWFKELLMKFFNSKKKSCGLRRDAKYNVNLTHPGFY